MKTTNMKNKKILTAAALLAFALVGFGPTTASANILAVDLNITGSGRADVSGHDDSSNSGLNSAAHVNAAINAQAANGQLNAQVSTQATSGTHASSDNDNNNSDNSEKISGDSSSRLESDAGVDAKAGQDSSDNSTSSNRGFLGWFWNLFGKHSDDAKASSSASVAAASEGSTSAGSSSATGTVAAGATASASSDITPPSIMFSTTLHTKADSVHVWWITGERSDSRVWVSENDQIDINTAASVKLDDKVYLHDATIANLKSNTLYHYTIGSVDAAGNMSATASGSFPTSAN